MKQKNIVESVCDLCRWRSCRIKPRINVMALEVTSEPCFKSSTVPIWRLYKFSVWELVQ